MDDIRRSLLIQLISIIVLFGILFSLFVIPGTVTPDSSPNTYPDQNLLAEDYDTYIGKSVGFDGQVVTTDPTVIVSTTTTGDHVRFTITDINEPVEEGERPTRIWNCQI